MQRVLQEMAEPVHTDAQLGSNFQPFDVGELLESVVSALRDQSAHLRASVILRIIEDVEMTGDLAGLHRILLRLLVEAVNAAPPGDVLFFDMRGRVGHGLELALRGAHNWRPRLLLVQQALALHRGQIYFDVNALSGPEARISFPATCIRWPKPQLKQQFA